MRVKVTYPPQRRRSQKLRHCGGLDGTGVRLSEAAVSHLDIDVAAVHAETLVYDLHDDVSVDGRGAHPEAQAAAAGAVAVGRHAEVHAVIGLREVLCFPHRIGRAAHVPVDALIGHAGGAGGDGGRGQGAALAVEVVGGGVVCVQTAQGRVLGGLGGWGQ